MPNPALTTYNTDGALVFGTQVVTMTIASASVTYIVEDGELTFPSNWVVTKNEVAVPNKQFGMPDVPTGRFTLQLASTTTPSPPLYTVFTAVALNAVSYTVIVSEVAIRSVQDGEAKVTIAVRYKLN